MLDLEGFVSETNATNIFMVKHGVVYTPTADSCLPGITRQTVISICKSLGISIEVRRLSLTEFYSADEVFTTGTMGELTPVRDIDGRVIGNDDIISRSVTKKIQAAYTKQTETLGFSIDSL
jgi:branched-subunit amino acid aminotransferase/4-amino-4-deoxychorismate lyase